MANIPGTFSNGGTANWIPPDLVWDEDNHPKIYDCSMHVTHHPNCDHKCGEPIELDSELQVEVLNEGRRFARAGMSFMGVPAAYQGKIPIPGIAVELVDLLMWMEAIKQILLDTTHLSEFDFEEMYREKKLNFIRAVREANEENIKKARLEHHLAVAQKPGLLGPDGNPV